MLDIQGSRILLGYSAGLDGKFAACLSVGVGYGPGSRTTALAERQDTVSRMIVDRIQDRLGSDGTVWHHPAQDLTPDLVRALIAELPRCGSVRLALELTRKADMAATRSASAAALAATQAALPLPANDQPPVLHPQLDKVRRICAEILRANTSRDAGYAAPCCPCVECHTCGDRDPGGCCEGDIQSAAGQGFAGLGPADGDRRAGRRDK